jgi:hypothetical protein
VSMIPCITNPDMIALCANIDGRTDEQLVLRLAIRGSQPSGRIKQAVGVRDLLAFDLPDRVLALNKAQESVVLASTYGPTGVASGCGNDLFFPARGGDHAEAVLWIRNGGGSAKVALLSLDPSGGTVASDVLPQHFEWKQWAVHAGSATYFATGKQKGGTNSMLRVLQLAPTTSAEPGGQLRSTEAIELWLPSDIEPTQLAAIDHDRVVILDARGGLHYWQHTFSSPIPLNHEQWERNVTSMNAGANGWIAVAARGKLRMWQIGRGGKLHLYDADSVGYGGMDISGVKDARRFVVTGDGKLLIALDMGGDLIGWEFPVLAADNF